jgi:hypothetical protein
MAALRRSSSAARRAFAACLLLLRLGRRRRRRRRGGGETARNVGPTRLLDTTRFVGGSACRGGALLLGGALFLGQLDAQRDRLVGGALVVGEPLRLGRLVRLGGAPRLVGTLGVGDALRLLGALGLLGALLVGGALGGLGLLGVLGALGVGTLRSREPLGLVLFGATLVVETARLVGTRLLLGETGLVGAPLVGQLARGLEPALPRIASARLVSRLLGGDQPRPLLRPGLVGQARLFVGAQRGAAVLLVGAPAHLALLHQPPMRLGRSRLLDQCTFAGQRTLSTTLVLARNARLFGGLAVARRGTKNAQTKRAYKYELGRYGKLEKREEMYARLRDDWRRRAYQTLANCLRQHCHLKLLFKKRKKKIKRKMKINVRQVDR